YTFADGIHTTGGSSYIDVEHNYAEHTGDDSFSCVGGGSYGGNGLVNYYVWFWFNTSISVDTSGVTVEGCQHVSVADNYIYNNGIRDGAAGIRVNSGAYWGTGGPDNVDVEYNTIEYNNVGPAIQVAS